MLILMQWKVCKAGNLLKKNIISELLFNFIVVFHKKFFGELWPAPKQVIFVFNVLKLFFVIYFTAQQSHNIIYFEIRVLKKNTAEQRYKVGAIRIIICVVIFWSRNTQQKIRMIWKLFLSFRNSIYFCSNFCTE